MSFGGNNKGNNYDPDNVNTRGLNFYNVDGFEPAMMEMGFWKTYLTIGIAPAKPEKERGKSGVYDYDNKLKAILDLPKAIALKELIKEKVLPVLAEGKDKLVDDMVSVPTKNGLVGVSLGFDEFDELKPHLVINTISAEDKSCETKLRYEFNTIKGIVNYKDSGSFDTSDNIYAELYGFLMYLEKGVEALLGHTAHAIRFGDRFSRNKLQGNVTKIAKHHGLIKSKGSYNNSSSRWDNSSGKREDVSDGDVKSVNDDDEIPF